MARWFLAMLVLVTMTAPVVGDRSAADRALRQGDKAEAVRIWTARAEAGDRDAQYRLARSYEDGVIVAADLEAAARLYRAAAAQGHAGAQTAAATIAYEAGDFAEARRWAEAAAADGCAAAAHLLGRMNLRGEGFAVDHAQAFRWFLLAEQRGHVLAAHDRRSTARLVPVEQRREIRHEVAAAG
ncbi:MAG: hypothetical protein AB7P02_23305 [Alphaproteobacteria bacterium]